MSSELFEVLSLTLRYLFSLLGLIIVLRAFFWLLADHREKEQRLKTLPDAGMIGEFVVQVGDSLPAGAVIPIPWEGTLGRLRSCDVVLPESGVGNRHLAFSFETDSGMMLHLFSGCEAMLDGRMIHCRTAESDSVMVHGSFLQIGSTLLQLRLFSGLNPLGTQAGPAEKQPFPSADQPFSDMSASFYAPQESDAGMIPFSAQGPDAGMVSFSEQVPDAGMVSFSEQDPVMIRPDGSSAGMISSPDHFNSSGPAYPAPPAQPEERSAFLPGQPPLPVPDPLMSDAEGADPAAKPSRRRRSEKWEADWSE